MPEFAHGLPRFEGGARPEAESSGRKRLIRGFALISVGITMAYLGWRLTATVNLAVWWVSLPLIATELHNGLGLAFYTLALWDIDGGSPPTPRHSTELRVAMLIPTLNEPEPVLLPAIAAAVALQPAHETWVLDDGRRPWVRALAAELGALYLARDTNEGAKAGNINHALGVIQADLIGVLDADYVAAPAFLTSTLGYFDDPQIAVVQTPQDFYNRDSFEHQQLADDKSFHEEAVFYRALAPGKNFWSAAFWCGTCAVVRVRALRDVGGVATETVTEDIHTSIRMYRLGWQSVYHNEVLARGLAPADARQYMMQRRRWATGAMQVLRLERPLFDRRLSPGQRLAFATTLLGWFDSWRALAYIVLPVGVLASGAAPIDAPGWVYGPAFVTALAAQFVALRLLARGYYPPLLSVLFEVLRMPAVLPATLRLLRPRGAAFRVTPKGRIDGTRPRTDVPALLWLLAAASTLGLLWFGATIAGLTPMQYHERPAVIGAACFAIANLGFLTGAIRRIRHDRFAAERREGFRFGVRLPGNVDGTRCAVDDLSATGARVHLPAGAAEAVGESPTLTVDLPAGAVEFSCAVRRRIEHGDGAVQLGLEFADGQRRKIARMALELLNGNADAQPAASMEQAA